MKIANILIKLEKDFITQVNKEVMALAKGQAQATLTQWLNALPSLFDQLRLQIGYDILDADRKKLSEEQKNRLKESLRINAAILSRSFIDVMTPLLEQEPGNYGSISQAFHEYFASQVEQIEVYLAPKKSIQNPSGYVSFDSPHIPISGLAWDLNYYIGYFDGWDGHSPFSVFAPIIPGYGQGYVDGQVNHFLLDAGITIARASYHLGSVALSGAEHLLSNFAHEAGHLSGEAISGIGNIAHDVVSGIGNVGGHVINGIGTVASGVGSVAKSCCKEDWSKYLGGTVVVSGGAATVASELANASPSTNPAPAPAPAPTPPPQPPGSGHHALNNVVHPISQHSHPVAHTSMHVVKHSVNLKTASTGIGIKTAITTGGALGISALAGVIAYGAALLPNIIKTTSKDIKNIFTGYKRKRSAKRMSARAIGMGIGITIGLLVPFGGPLTATALGLFGAWAGQKISKWWQQRQAKKKFHSVNDNNVLTKLDEDTSDRLKAQANNGCSNAEKYHLSSKEIAELRSNAIDTSSARIIMSRLETIARVEKIASKYEQNKLRKVINFFYGFYKENDKRKHALSAIKAIKQGQIETAQIELTALNINVSDQLVILNDNYQPSRSIAAR